MEVELGMALPLRGSQANEGDRCANRMRAGVTAGEGGGQETRGGVRGFLEVVVHEANRMSQGTWGLGRGQDRKSLQAEGHGAGGTEHGA